MAPAAALPARHGGSSRGKGEGARVSPEPDALEKGEAAAPPPFEAERWAPFVRDDMPLSCRERLKLAVGSVTLLPVRAVLLLLVVLALSAWTLALRHCARASPRRDRLLRGAAALAARALLFLCAFYGVEREGEDAAAARRDRPEEPALIVANHVSWLDAVVLAAEFGFPSFVAKASVAGVPVVGGLARSNHALFVSRRHHAKTEAERGGRCGPGPGDSCTAMIGRHQRLRGESEPGAVPRLMLFPEGTTSNGRQLLHFHRGAFAAGLPVRPVVLLYPYRHFSPAWESFYFVPHLLHSMCQLRQRVVVRYLPVHEPNERERGDAGLYAANVRARMAEAAGLPTSASRYPDKLAYHAWLSRVNGLGRGFWSALTSFYLSRTIVTAPAAAAEPTACSASP